MLDEQSHPAVTAPARAHRSDRPEGGLEEVEHVGTKVEERPVLEAPRRREDSAEQSVTHEDPPRTERVGGLVGRQEVTNDRRVAPREHHLGHHARGLHGADQVLGPAQAEREGLLQQQRASPCGRANGELALGVGRHAKGQRVAALHQLVEVAVVVGVVGRGHPLSSLGSSCPHTDQVSPRVRGEHRRVQQTSPRTGADDTHAQARTVTSHGLCLAPVSYTHLTLPTILRV